ncbi:MAG: dihydrodipicolinate synthase family protein [Terriglobia bacterium]
MPKSNKLAGVFAALPTPYGEDGAPRVDRLYPILDFLLERGITGFCLGGATGEYAACSVEERCTIFRSAARRLNGCATFILGVGGEHYGHVLRLGRVAAECGASAVLLPPPSFFPYDPADLVDFIRQAATELPLPVIFYNIPQFTDSLALRDVLLLADTVPNLAGIKDSSGAPENLPVLREAKAKLAFLIGSDDLLVSALEQGADGIISGTASACPELIQAVYEAFRSGEAGKARSLESLLNEFLARIAAFPPAWAIKLALSARGIEMGTLSWPMGERLRRKAQEFQEWFRAWAADYESACASRG